jgi:hypothetical protein
MEVVDGYGREGEKKARERVEIVREMDFTFGLSKLYSVLHFFWHLAAHYNYFIHTRPVCYLLHTCNT